jgi:TolA-binding protein
MSALECTTDLPARQQRARFSSSEQRALEAHYAVCSSCRTARQLLTDFAALDTVDPQDGARIERLAALARSRASGAPVLPTVPARKRTLVLSFAFAAALLLLVGGAFASVRLRRAESEPKPLPPVGASAIRNSLAATLTPTSPGTASVAPSAGLPESAPTGAASSAAPSTSVTADSTHVRAPDPLSAAALLRQAGAALRLGDRDAAVSLYQKLQTSFPASAEASLSHVSLGRLLADRGQPRAAMREFDRYLSVAPGGVLVPEALYGRARALTGLGDRAEELRTWQRLLRDFPDSTYAGRARDRLAQLE